MPNSPSVVANTPAAGLGDPNARLILYAPHRPALEPYASLAQLQPLAPCELAALVTATGNHWRKIFNLYAKLLHRLSPLEASWQACREQRLLQTGSATALHFSPPAALGSRALHLVMGKAHAEAWGLDAVPDLVSHGSFRYSTEQRLILTPYFDYRALSNARLDELYRLIDSQQLMPEAI